APESATINARELAVRFMNVPSACAARFQSRDPVAQLPILFLQAIVALVGLDHVERELLDFGEELRLHVADAHSFLLHFLRGRDLGQMVICLDVPCDVAERPEAVAGFEDIIRARGGYEYFL